MKNFSKAFMYVLSTSFMFFLISCGEKESAHSADKNLVLSASTRVRLIK